MGDLISRKWMIKELLKERDHYPPMAEERYSFGVKVPHSFNMASENSLPKNFDRIGYSLGRDGMNGCLVLERDSGRYYVVIGQCSNLFYLM